MEDGSAIALSSALDQRLDIIAAALGIAAPVGRERHVRFVELLRERLPPDRAAFVLYQLFLARLATQQEIESLGRMPDCERAEAVADFFLDSAEFKQGLQSTVRFETPPRDALLIDVSLTLTNPHNTGIQRVVRCAAEQMAAEGLEHRLIGFDSRLNQYRVLDAEAASSLIRWERPRKRSSLRLAEKLAPLKNALRRIVGKEVSETVRAFARAWRDARRDLRARRNKLKSAKDNGGAKTCLFLWDHRLLIPEVFGDIYRLERTKSLLAHTPLAATLIVYDLIPLQYPEFCSSSDGFIHYLSLLRHVDRISCISRTVEDDVRQLLPLIPRDRLPPVVETHYLGGDFDFSRAPAVVAGGETPVVLCVGSIETRKNQMGVLRAMVAAQDRGCRFRGVFVGKVDTAAEPFLHEVSLLQSRGYTVEVRPSVGEAELQELYSQSLFTMFCSFAEGFGLPIVESVVKGVPCIVSDRGCMREIAEKVGGCVFVDPQSDAALADAVEGLFRDGARRDALRAEARGAVWPTWRDYAREIHDFATADSAEIIARDAA